MAFRLKYSQIGPGFLAGLRVRTLLTVGLWRRLNNRWHGTRMGRYGARHRPHTCRNKGTGDCNLQNPGYFRCIASIELLGLQMHMSEKCHDARVNGCRCLGSCGFKKSRRRRFEPATSIQGKRCNNHSAGSPKKLGLIMNPITGTDTLLLCSARGVPSVVEASATFVSVASSLF